MIDHDCPQLTAAPVYRGNTDEAAIYVGELYAAVGADTASKVLLIVANDDKKPATIEATPEHAREIAAAIVAAADRAQCREMDW